MQPDRGVDPFSKVLVICQHNERGVVDDDDGCWHSPVNVSSTWSDLQRIDQVCFACSRKCVSVKVDLNLRPRNFQQSSSGPEKRLANGSFSLHMPETPSLERADYGIDGPHSSRRIDCIVLMRGKNRIIEACLT